MPSANELVERLKTLQDKLKDLGPLLKLDEKKKLADELARLMTAEDFWANPEEAKKIAQKHSHITSHHSFWSKLLADTEETLGIVQTNQDESPETMEYLHSQVTELEKKFSQKRIETLMSGKYDEGNCIFAIHAGAGGTDAQDWAEMLLRMYTRFFEKEGLETEILELSRGSEAGIKSALLEVKGLHAYGFLKAEHGVHRLVRLSPFNPAHTRETSFALVEVQPFIEDADVKLKDADLKIEANTSSGHGGQSVNTTYSAIRVTHIPTGIRVSIQNERSQHQNKEVALKILKSRLQALADLKLAEEKKELRGEFKSAEWGNQIRSYVLHPYKLVKDHRTGLERHDPENVLEGDLEELIEKYLESNTNDL